MDKESKEIKEDKKVLKALVDSFYISYDKLLKSVEKRRKIEKELGKEVVQNFQTENLSKFHNEGDSYENT